MVSRRCHRVCLMLLLIGAVFPAANFARGQDVPSMLPPAPVVVGSPISTADAVPDETTPTAAAIQELQGVDRKEIEAIVDVYLKKKEAERKKQDAEKKVADEQKKKADEAAKKAEEQANDHGVPFWTHYLCPSAHEEDPEQGYFLQSLYDSLSQGKSKKKWYEKLTIRGYTQVRFGRTLETEEGSSSPVLFGDRTITGNRENFLIRRARLLIFGDVSDHLYFYMQPDFASNADAAVNNTYFTQLRDLYADIYVDVDKVNRFRVGLSKVPYGWENLQSSQNRIALDRTDAMNTAVAPNERDLGVIYYWTPVEKRNLLEELVRSGLKGSGNYGIFALGAYNGQGGSQVERNLDLHMVTRLTWPMALPSGQIIEGSVQALRGDYVVTGAPISPLGKGTPRTPLGTGGNSGIREQRVAGSFVFFPQPFGFQAEWQVGDGPGLNDAQTAVINRPLYGGYVMAMYRQQTDRMGIIMPFVRYQQFTGGYRNIADAPYGNQRQYDIGVEWQLRKELELVFELSQINSPNFSAVNTANTRSFQDFEGSIFRVQCQFNY